MALTVSGPARREPVIELSALFGQFRVPGSDYTVKFASTFASTETTGHRELLDELKPMRDRIAASALTDLTALLQRDLNDRRVARELIPYLLGSSSNVQSRIGFFPAVLAVLIPTGYLQQGPDDPEPVTYPTPQTAEDGSSTVKYVGGADGAVAWETARYAAEGQVQPVGILRIHPRQSEVVVLDGQHRSNAFRYLAGAFDPSTDIYGEFYRDITVPEVFSADLPVTIVWFEADNEARIEPRMISRQLFVDVNNSAHSVSLARTILLDDRSVTAIATQSFYNQAAEEGFRSGSFSLLHAAFDMDSDLADAVLPAFALTSPEIVEAAFAWLLLGSSRYSDLRIWRADRARAFRNRNQFAALVGDVENVNFRGEDDDGVVQLSGPEHALHYRRLMKERVTPAFWKAMTGLSFLGAHYRAASAVEQWVENEAPLPIVPTWRKIFTGGEGLYWTFRDRVSDRNVYRQAATDIERRFREERGRELGVDPAEADAAFKSFATKAFQVGFVMAAAYLAERGRGDGNLVQATEELIARLNRFTPANWLVLFRELRPLLIRGDTAPKVWPMYRNLLIRMYDQGHGELMPEPEDLPEREAYGQALVSHGRRLAEDEGELSPEDALRIARNERERINEVFGRAGLSNDWFASDSAITQGRAILVKAFEDA